MKLVFASQNELENSLEQLNLDVGVFDLMVLAGSGFMTRQRREELSEMIKADVLKNEKIKQLKLKWERSKQNPANTDRYRKVNYKFFSFLNLRNSQTSLHIV